ncbi:glycosyltransferase family 2 protein [Oceanobacillus kimchii]|uniref:glycosyltransferase family 2 protein n=1 Tax=Oceanobacillus kimchii TaxID=746691 RepID=UPI003C728077
MDKISVIVPVYNVEEILPKCLNSLLSQTFKNIEIILVNDGSTDNSGLICDDFSSNHDIIKVIHKDNGGQSSARNIGVKEASGDYIGFVDSDDWIHPELFSYLYKILINTDSDISDISAVFTKSDEKVSEFQPKEELDIIDGSDNILINYMYSGLADKVGQFAVWRKLYKKNLFDEVSFLEGKVYEDILINFHLLSKARRIVRSNQILYYYHQENFSTTRNKFKEKDLDLIFICEELCRLANKKENKYLSYLTKIKLARSYFSLLAKISKFGVSEELSEKKKMIEKDLKNKLRKNYILLMKSPMPFNRKIFVTFFAINHKLLSTPLKIMKSIKS